MNLESLKTAFVEGVYKRVSELPPEQREQIKAEKEELLTKISAVGTFLDVANEYVNSALLFVEGLYVDVKEEAPAPKAAVQPKADSSTLSHIYLYLLESENYTNYGRTFTLSGQPGAQLDLYHEILDRTTGDTDEIARRQRWNLSELGYSGVA